MEIISFGIKYYYTFFCQHTSEFTQTSNRKKRLNELNTHIFGSHFNNEDYLHCFNDKLPMISVQIQEYQYSQCKKYSKASSMFLHIQHLLCQSGFIFLPVICLKYPLNRMAIVIWTGMIEVIAYIFSSTNIMSNKSSRWSPRSSSQSSSRQGLGTIFLGFFLQ